MGQVSEPSNFMCSLERLAAAMDLLGVFLVEQIVQPFDTNNTVGLAFTAVPVSRSIPAFCGRDLMETPLGDLFHLLL
jgi:hypothetical protein